MDLGCIIWFSSFDTQTKLAEMRVENISAKPYRVIALQVIYSAMDYTTRGTTSYAYNERYRSIVSIASYLCISCQLDIHAPCNSV